MTPHRVLGICVLLRILLVSPAAAEDNPPDDRRLRTGVGFHYSVGDYGGSTSTSIVYTPLITRAELDRWTMWLTVPYIRISGPGGVVQGPDGPVQTTGGVSEGLGDIVLRGAYLFPAEPGWIPSLELLGLVKFPTASRDRGLGTGEYDFGLESELSWEVGRLMPFVVFGYRFLGSSAETPLHDVFECIPGVQYLIAPGINLGVLLDYRQAASAQSGTRLETVPFASFRVRHHWAIDLYGAAGLADGSPDAGFGFQLAYVL